MSTELPSSEAAVSDRSAVLEAHLEEGRFAIGRVRVARSLWSRFLGLMGRSQLDPDEALWLVPCRSIHMFFMRTRIDVAFLDRHGLVVRTVSEMRPWSLRPMSVTLLPVRGAHSALELAPGSLRRLDIVPGSRLTFHPSMAHKSSSDDTAPCRATKLKGAGE